MSLERPLKAHPQLTVHRCSATGSTEYKLQNWKPLDDGSIPTSAWTFFDYVVVAVFAILQAQLKSRAHWIAALLYIWLKCNTIISESAIALPGLGVQLEKHRGIPHTPFSASISLSCSRTFIPMASIKDIVINEGLRRWDVRFYLAIIHQAQSASPAEEFIRIAIPFQEIQPPFPILREVYHGLRETLYDEYGEDET
ncbi:hypothetical protein FRB95_009189 [Tulasnella sp. JGI-2019a]|nr:hypothetical protein FRB95_009189 [Tulasnella sp. JGI-2019a]